mmetsp:Transcript_13310/g.33493  ORF Transcript_13310/g.33493 Transcript_13310/m.33493 type:complete len:263 (-) Transcript_13310:100-888(-)
MLSHPSFPLSKVLALSSVFTLAEAAAHFLIPSNPIGQKALELRGGWNPLDSVDTTNAITRLGLGLGAATTISTRTVLDELDIENVDPISLLVARRIGGSILNFFIIAYCVLCQGTSVATAVAMGSLVIVVELSKTLFDGTPKTLGFPALGQAIFLATTVLFSYAALNDTPIAKDDLLKIWSGWVLLNGVLMGCFPKLACKTWGDIDASDLSALQSFVSYWGFSLLSVGVLTGLLTTDLPVTQAVGLGAVPFLTKIVLSKKPE